MTDLASWLLEQIAEDERVAGDLAADGYPKHGGRVLSVQGTLAVPWPDRWNPVQVLAECDAKRRRIELHSVYRPYAPAQPTGYLPAICLFCTGDGEVDVPMPCEHLKLEALPYAARPGYREEWRP